MESTARHVPPPEATATTSLTFAATLACIWGALYSWPVIENAKAAGGAAKWLGCEHWSQSPLLTAWGLGPLLGSMTLPAAMGILTAAVSTNLAVVFWVIKLTIVCITPAIVTTDWMTSKHPVFLGVGGCTIMACFLATALLWAARPGPRSLADWLQLEGYAFFLSAAWVVCGALGAPGFALYPDKQETQPGTREVTALAHLIMFLFVTGWLCTAAAQWLTYRDTVATVSQTKAKAA